MRHLPVLLSCVSMLIAAPVLAEGDAALGQKVFTTKCKACHTIDASGKNGVGPGLHGLFGRKAGSKEGYSYSPAMAASGILWNADTLKSYIINPKETVSGNKMSFAGIKNPEEMENLIAYLKEASK